MTAAKIKLAELRAERIADELAGMRDEVAIRVFAAAFATMTGVARGPSPERSGLLKTVAGLAFEAADEFMKARE